MPTIIDGTAGITFPNSTIQASAGQVLQVVNATFGTIFTTNSSTYTDCGLTASITPKFATSKILVFVNLCGVSKATGNTAFNAKLVRNSTDILQVEGVAGFTNTTTDNNIGSVSTSYLDSPATTSATTYKVQVQSGANIAVVRINNTYILGSTSTITLMEIAA
jgi:hypothetical protein